MEHRAKPLTPNNNKLNTPKVTNGVSMFSVIPLSLGIRCIMAESQNTTERKQYKVKTPLWRQIERQSILNKYAENENNCDMVPAISTPHARGEGPLERLAATAARKACEVLNVPLWNQ